MHFVGPDGTFRATVADPDSSPNTLQNMSGVIVGNRLIVSETGNNQFIAVDLSTLEASIFREVDSDHGWLGAIEYVPADGLFYLGHSMAIRRFTEAGPLQMAAQFTGGNVTGIAAVGRFLYVVFNHEGTLRRVDPATGASEVLLNLDYPVDIEYLPVGLVER